MPWPFTHYMPTTSGNKASKLGYEVAITARIICHKHTVQE